MDTSIKSKPEISVLMPAYNAEAYIAVAIQSVLDQTFQNFELIIIDDGSTDKTKEIVTSFTDVRIRLIVNEYNTGLSSVRNQALQESTAEYIAFLDSDDIALKNRLLLQKEFLDTHTAIGLVGTAVQLIDASGKKTGVRWISSLTSSEMTIALLFHNQFAQSSVMLRKSILPTEVYREGYAPAEDYDLWVRVAKVTKVWNLPEVLTYYRIHEKGSSQIQKSRQLTAITAIQKNLLNELGVSATDSEMEVHKKRHQKQKEGLLEFLTSKKEWLLRLVSANKKNKVYPDKIFLEGVAREWFTNCYANTVHGLRVLYEFKSSRLSRETWVGRKWQIFKFTVKCTLHLP